MQQQVPARRDLARLPLVVALPADQVTPDLEVQLAAAIQRYCAARIEDNLLRIRHSRLQHSVGLAVALGVVVAVIALVLLLVSTVLSGISALAQGMIAGGLCVFAWVILWTPLEALLFDWVEPTPDQPRLRPAPADPRHRTVAGIRKAVHV